MGKKRKLDKEQHSTDSRLRGNNPCFRRGKLAPTQAGAVKVKVMPT
jgi:hypothetical protein